MVALNLQPKSDAYCVNIPELKSYLLQYYPNIVFTKNLSFFWFKLETRPLTEMETQIIKRGTEGEWVHVFMLDLANKYKVPCGYYMCGYNT